MDTARRHIKIADILHPNKRNYKIQIKQCKMYSGADICTNHNLLSVKYNISMKENFSENQVTKYGNGEVKEENTMRSFQKKTEESNY